MRTFKGVVLLVISQGLIGCNGSRPSLPLAPSTVSQPMTQPAPATDGTMIAGTVADTAFRPLAGAIVEVVDGPQAGMTTTADVRGDFSFRGTFDDTTRFHATKEGYVAATGTLGPPCAPCNPHRWIHFYLEVLAAPVALTGDYALTFSAAFSCSGIPDEMRTRTYAAAIPPAPHSNGPANAYYTVTLSEATFAEGYNSFEMGVAGDYVGFWLEPVVERVGENAYLSFNGSASASVDASAVSTISTTFDGTIEYCVVKPDTGQYSDCYRGQALSRS